MQDFIHQGQNGKEKGQIKVTNLSTKYLHLKILKIQAKVFKDCGITTVKLQIHDTVWFFTSTTFTILV